MKKHSFCKTNHASLNMTNDQVLKYDPQHDNQQIEKEDAEIRSSFPIKEQQSSLSVIDQVKHSQLLSFASTIPLALSKTTFEFYSEMCNEFKKSQARIVESKTKNINPIEITVDSVEAVDSVTRSQGRCSPSLSSLSENSIDQLLEENITHWKPQPETQAAMCYDFDFKVDGVSQSSVAMHRKSEMIERWKSADAEFIKEYTPTLSSSMFVRGNLEGVDLDEESRRLRKEIVKRQIKEAKQHKKLFGEWVRKQWIQDESERRMWQEAEKKMRIKIERTEQEITEGKVEKTLEELISELKEAECVGATEEILQNLKSEIKKREQKLYKKIQKDELTFFQRDWIWAARHNRRDISSGEMKKILRNEEDSACTVGFTNNECSSSFELSKNSEKTLSSVEPESVFDPNLQTPCNKISSVGSTFTTAMHFSKQPNNKILKAQASNLSFKIPSSEQRVSSANSEILAKLHFLQSEKIHVSDFEELLSPYSVLNDCIEEEEIPTTEEVVLLDRDEWFDRFSDPFLNPKIKRRMKRRGEDVQAFVEQESQYNNFSNPYELLRKSVGIDLMNSTNCIHPQDAYSIEQISNESMRILTDPSILMQQRLSQTGFKNKLDKHRKEQTVASKPIIHHQATQRRPTITTAKNSTLSRFPFSSTYISSGYVQNTEMTVSAVSSLPFSFQSSVGQQDVTTLHEKIAEEPSLSHSEKNCELSEASGLPVIQETPTSFNTNTDQATEDQEAIQPLIYQANEKERIETKEFDKQKKNAELENKSQFDKDINIKEEERYTSLHLISDIGKEYLRLVNEANQKQRQGSPITNQQENYEELLKSLKITDTTAANSLTISLPSGSTSESSSLLNSQNLSFARKETSKSPPSPLLSLSSLSQPSSPSTTSCELDAQLEENITRWQPQPRHKVALSRDVDFEVEGRHQSAILTSSKKHMIKQWEEQDAEFAQQTQEYSSLAEVNRTKQEKGTRSDFDIKEKIRKKKRSLIKRQIKDARMFMKVYGVWVRKEWISDQEEKEMWNEAEKKIHIKQEAIENEDILHGKEHETLEEMKNKLRDADINAMKNEEKEALEAAILKRERKLQEKKLKSEQTDLQRFLKTLPKNEDSDLVPKNHSNPSAFQVTEISASSPLTAKFEKPAPLMVEQQDGDLTPTQPSLVVTPVSNDQAESRSLSKHHSKYQISHKFLNGSLVSSPSSHRGSSLHSHVSDRSSTISTQSAHSLSSSQTCLSSSAGNSSLSSQLNKLSSKSERHSFYSSSFVLIQQKDHFLLSYSKWSLLHGDHFDFDDTVQHLVETVPYFVVLRNSGSSTDIHFAKNVVIDQNEILPRYYDHLLNYRKIKRMRKKGCDVPSTPLELSIHFDIQPDQAIVQPIFAGIRPLKANKRLKIRTLLSAMRIMILN
eukprot:MONOS_3466.1-p1 / transcript=MONOS_3466.1 / gene=MONOS_3466 / organism=Monocercomonoides_exilis_PA203 / gene_product=unspecified product / transcript_product=unspecified product / location=Mono_scaffold00082:35965-40672(-) / protein_length=1395 / sequence_SO=supercontig / SO=protein_coding / is_pseudo=false